ncbi:hypothetical protein [Pseudarthrobacter sp. H2]|uniref:hypothetical protein n=1 Tax=Pseudarthrobacter sp. H2 TaxID=3418415 RepID=UPI003CF23474
MAAGRFTGVGLGSKAVKVVAKSVGDDFFRRKVDAEQDEMVKHHTASPAAALAMSKPALERCHAAEAPTANIADSELVRLRADM